MPVDAGFSWKNEAVEGGKWAVCRLVKVLAYDDNGWKHQTKAVPKKILVSVPVAHAAVGTWIRVKLLYAPRYEGKFSINGMVVTSQFVP